MNPSVDLGLNRTGIGASPFDTATLLKGIASVAPTPGNEEQSLILRQSYMREGVPVGTVPLPTSLKGLFTNLKDNLTGHDASVLIDKLAERLAFERTGVRLYQHFLNKCSADDDVMGAEAIATIRGICDEELQHFTMLTQVMEQIGADPTAMTPAVDMLGVLGTGFVQVVMEPRLTAVQSLEAILVIELMDNEGWPQLVRLAGQHGLKDFIPRFEAAEAAEARHLQEIRRLTERHLFQPDAALH